MAQNIMQATSSLPSILVSQYVASSETTQYTVPATTSMKISSATLCNVTSTAATISLSLVKAGGTAGVSNRVIYSYSLAAGDSIRVDEIKDAFLGPGDAVSGLAGTASAIVLVLTGVVFS